MEEMIQNPYDLFAENQETYEEAVKKSADESQSFQRTKHFRIDSVGTYPVRILPLAPTKQSDGNYVLDRKGYEYPIKTQVLKLDNPHPTGKKDKQLFVNVCQSSYAGLSVDLIDTYLKVAEDKYGNDEKLIKKIKGSGFEGGLKWNSQRAMYILDLDNRSEGIQMLTLSYSQYKDLEDRKLAIWKKLLEKNSKCLCPISSVKDAFPVEITRKEENKKTTYTFNIDTISGVEPLSEEEINALLEMQRIPDAIYRYSRFHMEATIEFLKQYDAKMEMDVMSSKEITEAIEKIKMELHPDDKSHFSFDKKERNSGDNEEASDNELDSLWNRWEKLNERGIGDKSEEGQDLRDAIREYIDANELNVRVTRGKTNEDLLNDIEDALEVAKDGNNDEDKATATAKDPAPEEEPAPAPEEEDPAPEPDPVPAPTTHRRGEYNDDTNEPAVSPSRERRSARPERRRR
ncbi:hypothetical protein [Bacteroides congonensis]|uniref:hypothetical protein n=1 Tax=Bacteroides congonensis TaxID=1871006 RepID=UPI003219640E